MLADQLDYIVGVDPHRDSHHSRSLRPSARWSFLSRPSSLTAAVTAPFWSSSSGTIPVGVRSRSRAPARSGPA
jgi:hypothetical protein